MRTGPGVHFLDAAAPEGMRLYAIGDVHGRFDLLKEMHTRVRGEIVRDRPADWRIIHVGDYVDRGPQSREVIELLLELTRSDPHVVALAGNHDIGFVDFLRRPAAVSLFAHNGGEQTARSYGVEVDLAEALREGRRARAYAGGGAGDRRKPRQPRHRRMAERHPHRAGGGRSGQADHAGGRLRLAQREAWTTPYPSTGARPPAAVAE